MLSKNNIQEIKQLQQKKYRHEHACFVVETPKIFDMFCKSNYSFVHIYALSGFLEQIPPHLKTITTLVSEEELHKISALKQPNQVLAIVQETKTFISAFPKSGKFLVLDHIQDPGNLGALIRIADWFNLPHILCSTDTVDVYNAKTIQASMGSVANVQVYYTDLLPFLQEYKKYFSIYATHLSGTSYRTLPKTDNILLILGNEANGISSDIQAIADEKITIPKFGKAESLNVAVAAGILVSDWIAL